MRAQKPAKLLTALKLWTSEMQNSSNMALCIQQKIPTNPISRHAWGNLPYVRQTRNN